MMVRSEMYTMIGGQIGEVFSHRKQGYVICRKMNAIRDIHI